MALEDTFLQAALSC